MEEAVTFAADVAPVAVGMCVVSIGVVSSVETLTDSTCSNSCPAKHSVLRL
jgi:hypothetical protein